LNADSKIDAEDVTSITRTLRCYERHAEAFRDSVLDHDVSQSTAAPLSHITRPAPFSTFDRGCGPGRDLKYFAALGR
jgi:hypothetical protein